jgi:ABC-type Fe3+-hydroxamate transport system substrate-binding protein
LGGITTALVTLIDDRNREVDIPDKIERIISLSPAVTEILFELGLGDKIVGITPYCVRPEEAKKKKKVGSYGYANIEQFRELKPDVVLTVTGYQSAVANQLSPYFPTFSFRLPSSLSGVIDLVTKVGIVAGQAEKGRIIERELLEDLKKIEIGGRKDVYFECDLGSPITFGSLSYITDVLHFMNFSSIYSDVMKEWLYPDFEYVKERDPEFMIIEPKMFSRREEHMIKKLVEGRKWNQLSAYKDNKIFLTPGPYDFFAHHGPSLIREVLPWLEKIG